jgi:CheY-like chemotaxis protein
LTLRAEDAPYGSAGVRFEVIDTGVGIPNEAMAKLFQPFHQVLGQHKRRAGGTGLGLAISQRIAEAMGARIEVESRLGGGSRFWFSASFARDLSETHTVSLDSSMGGLDEVPALCGTVLVVEDNDVNRMIAREVLQSLGMRVHEVANGMEALEALDRKNFDVVLMDCFMPVLDGYATAREIRRIESSNLRSRIPIIAVTANAFEEDAQEAIAAGMDAHLAKPYTRAQLRDLLKSWL